MAQTGCQILVRKVCPNSVLTARGTEGSNLLSSSAESANYQFRSRQAAASPQAAMPAPDGKRWRWSLWSKCAGLIPSCGWPTLPTSSRFAARKILPGTPRPSGRRGFRNDNDTPPCRDPRRRCAKVRFSVRFRGQLAHCFFSRSKSTVAVICLSRQAVVPTPPGGSLSPPAAEGGPLFDQLVRRSGFKPSMTGFKAWASHARQIGNDGKPPDSAVQARGLE
jgi:hypothetical protein